MIHALSTPQPYRYTCTWMDGCLLLCIVLEGNSLFATKYAQSVGQQEACSPFEWERFNGVFTLLHFSLLYQKNHFFFSFFRVSFVSFSFAFVSILSIFLADFWNDDKLFGYRTKQRRVCRTKVSIAAVSGRG